MIIAVILCKTRRKSSQPDEVEEVYYSVVGPPSLPTRTKREMKSTVLDETDRPRRKTGSKRIENSLAQGQPNSTSYTALQSTSFEPDEYDLPSACTIAGERPEHLNIGPLNVPRMVMEGHVDNQNYEDGDGYVIDSLFPQPEQPSSKSCI